MMEDNKDTLSMMGAYTKGPYNSLMGSDIPRSQSYWKKRAMEKPGKLRTWPKIGRNEQCPCGSGKKFKRCCIDTWEGPAMEMYQLGEEAYENFKDKLKVMEVEMDGHIARLVYIICEKFADFIKAYIEGFGGEYTENYTNSGFIMIQFLNVPDEIQNKGIGTALIDRIKEIACEDSLPIMLTTEIDTNEGLRSFYNNRGFKEITECLYIWLPEVNNDPGTD